MSVYTKLMAARMRLHGQPIKKSGYNSFAKYAYMELADFLVPTQTIFAELGLCGVVSFDSEIASLTIIDTEDGSQHVITSPMGSAALKGCHEVQNIGAVETYQRRYLWVAAMEIVEHDALDSSEPVKQGARFNHGKDFKATPKMDAFESLQPEVQNFLRKSMKQVTDAMPDAQRAKETLLMALDEWPDEDPAQLKIAAWHLLDSTTRAAIKKAEATA